MAHAVSLLPLIVFVSLAAVIDWRTRRIPNALNLIIFCTGLGVAWEGGTHVSFAAALLGSLVGFGLLLPAFVLGAMGGGDVKLLAALGAWCGPVGVVFVLNAATVIGMVIAIVQPAQSGKLYALFKNSGLLAINLLHVRTVGADHIQQTGKRFRSIDRPLPYAVPLGAGVLIFCLVF
ncbi:MAG: A24 family peptidase [Tepidisphaeraceae bacterium]